MISESSLPAHRNDRLQILRWSRLIPIALLAALPFLWTPIPPLVDVPGHIGGFAVQIAAPGSAIGRFFGFRWVLTLNLASDLLVQGLHRRLGLFLSVRLICAVSAALSAASVFVLARVLNPRGAYALPWALLFVFDWPFLWGFLNYSLATSLAFLAFAAWAAMEDRLRLRAGLFMAITPLIFIGHGVSGTLLVVMIVSFEAARLWLPEPGRWTHSATSVCRTIWPPALACLATLAVWRLFGAAGDGATQWLASRKIEAVVMMLRDQNVALDIGSLLACLAVWVVGRRWGARLRGGAVGPVLAVTVLFLVTPSLISGSNRIDTRLAPCIPLLALTLQDWRLVNERRRRAVAIAGILLLSVRFAITTGSFIDYSRRYGQELAALDHVRSGARILNLTASECGLGSWRGSRLDHLASLATPLRQAWVNAQWSVSGLQLLNVRYRPSPHFYKDPSQRIWPEDCIDHRQPSALRARHGLIETMPALPLDDVDYLWLIGERLPPGYHDTRLHRLWKTTTSELYLVRHRPRDPVPDVGAPGLRTEPTGFHDNWLPTGGELWPLPRNATWKSRR